MQGFTLAYFNLDFQKTVILEILKHILRAKLELRI